MSISECSNKILEWYRDGGEVFTIDKSNKIIEIADDPEERDALVKASLEYLDSLELVKRTVFREKEYWVLKKRIESYSQTIEINETLAIGIAGEINQFCEIIDDYTDICSAADITEKDIKNLLLMYVHAKGKLIESEGEKEIDEK